MTPEQFKSLQSGDSISHIMHPLIGYMVAGNYGDHVTAVRVVDATNPQEWILNLAGHGTRQEITQRSPIGQAWLSIVNKLADSARNNDLVRVSMLRDLIRAFEKEFPEETAAENKFWGKDK